MNRKDYQALTLVGPTRGNPELDPLAVQHLDNQLFMSLIPKWNKLKSGSSKLGWTVYKLIKFSLIS